jgi:hypothetical protein
VPCFDGGFDAVLFIVFGLGAGALVSTQVSAQHPFLLFFSLISQGVGAGRSVLGRDLGRAFAPRFACVDGYGRDTIEAALASFLLFS